MILSIVEEVNKKTGEAECQFYRRGLSYTEEGQRIPEIQLSRFLYCQGELKNNKGQVQLRLAFVFRPAFCQINQSIKGFAAEINTLSFIIEGDNMIVLSLNL